MVWSTLFQWSDNVSWIHGKHSVKFGAEIRRNRFNEIGTQDARAALTVQKPEGDQVVDTVYMTGNTCSKIRSAAPWRSGNTRSTATQAYFVDDGIKLQAEPDYRSGLALRIHAGVVDEKRYRGECLCPTRLPFRSRRGLWPRLRNKWQAASVWCVSAAAIFIPTCSPPSTPRFAQRGAAGWDRTWLNRTTRILLRAWVSPGALARSGPYVLAWDSSTSRTPATRYSTPPATLFGNVQNFANIVTHNLTFESPFTLGGTNVCGVPSPPYTCLSTPQGLANQYDRRTPYVEEVELNIQRQLTGDMVLEVGYLGSESHFLQRFLTLNMPATMSATATVNSREPDPSFGNIQYVGGVVNANYNALTAKLTRRLSKRSLTFLVGYTFSKAIDEGSGIQQRQHRSN